jgi:hypothetical protein
MRAPSDGWMAIAQKKDDNWTAADRQRERKRASDSAEVIAGPVARLCSSPVIERSGRLLTQANRAVLQPGSQ